MTDKWQRCDDVYLIISDYTYQRLHIQYVCVCVYVQVGMSACTACGKERGYKNTKNFSWEQQSEGDAMLVVCLCQRCELRLLVGIFYSTKCQESRNQRCVMTLPVCLRIYASSQTWCAIYICCALVFVCMSEFSYFENPKDHFILFTMVR